MKAFLKMFLLYCCTVPLFAESGAPVPFVDHPPVDAAALHLHEQEMAFMDERFKENTDSRIIWQADHKIALGYGILPEEPISIFISLKPSSARKMAVSRK